MPIGPVTLQIMSKSIDLLKLLSIDAYSSYTKTRIKVKTYVDPIKSGKAPLDLIHTSYYGLFLYSYNGVKYFVSF